MIVKFRKLYSGLYAAVEPERAHETDAGFDLTAVDREDHDGYIEYFTGIAVEIPLGYVGLLFPRSSVSKTCLSLANSVGVIDAGYHGEIRFRFRTGFLGGEIYEVGDRIGQLVILALPDVEFVEGSFSKSERGEGGFGSTGA